MKKIKIKFGYKKGSYLPIILIASVLFIALASALMGIALSNIKRASNNERLVSSLNVAEAGINYYIWHLSHDNKDYCDGNACSGSAPYGPYTHDYRNSQNQIIGSYSLYITPPSEGDALVKVRAVGKLSGSKSESVVIADIGMPSFARYAFITNSECWFGTRETTNGPVHSNAGVHFDGTSNAIVSSSLRTYRPSRDFGGDGAEHDGVWGNGGPKGFWVYPVPAVDFNKISVDFTDLQIEAQDHGVYLDKSNSSGYYLKLRGSSIEVYRVTRVRSTGITTSLVNTINQPQNGVIYVNDSVWVDGTYDGKLTIAVKSSEGNKTASIYIKDNLLYQSKDGSASIGLVAQDSIVVPSYANTNLEIDGALLAQNGHVWFPQANGSVKDSISIYGSIASNLPWTWGWLNGFGEIGSGYRNTTQTYDQYLTLAPPPQFPTTGSYALLSWREE